MDGAGKLPLLDLVALAHVDHGDALAEDLSHLRWVDLIDLVLDAAQELRAGDAAHG